MAGSKQLPVGTFEQIQQADDTHKDGTVVEVPEWGMSVRIRGLTRGEVRLMDNPDLSQEDKEASILRCAFVEPALSEEQARVIVNDKSPGPTEKLLNTILEASGLLSATFRS